MPEEVFFLFIASCIGLWLIQLATEWIDRRRTKRGTLMKRYRGHLILAKAHQEPDTDDWRASIHVQFNEGALTFRDVQLPGPTSYFSTKTAAEKHALKEAKRWIDRRLHEAKIFGR
jgi:stage V sporulation protein G